MVAVQPPLVNLRCELGDDSFSRRDAGGLGLVTGPVAVEGKCGSLAALGGEAMGSGLGSTRVDDGGRGNGEDTAAVVRWLPVTLGGEAIEGVATLSTCTHDDAGS